MAKQKDPFANFVDIYNATQQPKKSNALTTTPTNPVMAQGGTTTPTPTTTGVTVANNNPVLPSNANAYETAKFLYDTRLQNVFSDYQTAMNTLKTNEQKQLQDAYYIRELSKKYLGEYGSNVGIGDVSGNLLDIYSNYQQNITQIQQNSQTLALNLQTAYDQQSRDAFEQALAAQMQAQQMEMDSNAQNIVFSITQGNTNGLEWNQYLQSQLDSGAITQEQYNLIYQNVYTAKVSEIESNIGRGFFGFKTNESGERVPQTVEEYIIKNRAWLSDNDYLRLMDFATYGKLEEGEGVWQSADLEDLPELDLGYQSYNFSINVGGQTLYYSSVKDDVDTEEGSTVTSEDLYTRFEEVGDGESLISGQTIVNYRGTNYVYVEGTMGQGGKWYRLFNSTAFASEEGAQGVQRQWVSSVSGANQLVNGLNFTFEQKSGDWDGTFKFRGVEWNLDKDWEFADKFIGQGEFGDNYDRLEDAALGRGQYSSQLKKDKFQKEAKAIYDAFKNIHGIDLGSGDPATDPRMKGFKTVVVKVGSYYYVLRNDKGGGGAKLLRYKAPNS